MKKINSSRIIPRKNWRKCLFFLLLLAIILLTTSLFLVYLGGGRSTNSYKFGVNFSPLQHSFLLSNNPRRNIIIYNRIPKTGSTTFTNAVAYDLCERNGFHVAHLNLTKNRVQMHRAGQFLLAKNVTEWTEIQPLFLHGHFVFVDFESLGFTAPIWINILREPFERFLSYYYFLRYGDDFRIGLKRSKAGNNETFDECFLRGSKECDPNSVWLQIPYFCGTAHFCFEPGNQQAFEMARHNLLQHFLLVGTTERMSQMVELLELLLPEFFDGAVEHFRSLNATRAHLRHTTKKVRPSLEVEQKFKQHAVYRMERDFYEFAAREFENVWRRLEKSKSVENGGRAAPQFHFEKIRP